jgi:isoleucyl-tRNA synthetase
LAVVLDTTLTDELKAEGLMRDIVRHVQNLRKTTGLKVEDRIVLYLASDDATAQQALEKFGEVIAAETLATEMSDTPVGEATDNKIGDIHLQASLKKV